MRRIIAAVATLGLAAGASGCGASSGSESGSGGGSVGKPDVTVEAKKITKEFENNEAAADGKYKGKTLKVSGIVDKVDTDFMDDSKYIVQIGGGGQFVMFTVNCNGQSSKAVSKIKKGQKVTVVGKFDDGGDLGVELEPCKIQ